MEFVDYKKALKEGKKFGAYLFEGEDAFFLTRGVELLRATFVVDPALDLAVFSGEDGVDAVLSSLDSFSFSGTRLTVVKEFYPDEKALSKLSPYLSETHEGSVLAIVNKKAHAPLKKFPALSVVNCGRADRETIIRWIVLECKRNGVYIEESAAFDVWSFTLGDMSRVELETKKLIAYAGKGGTIGRKEVSDIVNKDNEYKMYKLAEHIGKKERETAIFTIKEMLSLGESPQRIISNIYTYFRRLLFVAISDLNEEELFRELKLKESQAFLIRTSKAQAKMFKKRALKQAVDMLSDFDYRIKNGKIDGGSALDYAVLKLLAL